MAALALLCLIAVGISIVLYVKIVRLRRRLDRFMVFSDKESFEEIINDNSDRLKDLEDAVAVLDQDLNDLDALYAGSFSKYGVKRYDAYGESIEKRSFAIAMLDDDDCGFLLNVVNGRDGSYSYIKDIKNGASSLALSEDEAAALEKAKTGRRKRHVRH